MLNNGPRFNLAKTRTGEKLVENSTGLTLRFHKSPVENDGDGEMWIEYQLTGSVCGEPKDCRDLLRFVGDLMSDFSDFGKGGENEIAS